MTFLEGLVQSPVCKTPRTQENDLRVQHGLCFDTQRFGIQASPIFAWKFELPACVVVLRGMGEFWIWAELALASLQVSRYCANTRQFVKQYLTHRRHVNTTLLLLVNNMSYCVLLHVSTLLSHIQAKLVGMRTQNF